jgi:hypothetical protein
MVRQAEIIIGAHEQQALAGHGYALSFIRLDDDGTPEEMYLFKL